MSVPVVFPDIDGYPGASTYESKARSMKALLPLLLLLSGCELLGLGDAPEQYEATVEEIVAPSEVAVGSSFEIVLRGSSGCAEVARVEKEEAGTRVLFTVWLHEKDGICGIVPNHFDIERTLRFTQAGEYAVVAGEVEATVVAERDSPQAGMNA